MQKINRGSHIEYELTPVEEVVHDWYTSLRNGGYDHGETIERMMTLTAPEGFTWRALNNQEFRDWLFGYRTPAARHDCRTPDDLQYLGKHSDPELGVSYECRDCRAPWLGRDGKYTRVPL